jgi:uncharacterized protein (TIGR03437 family)
MDSLMCRFGTYRAWLPALVVVYAVSLPAQSTRPDWRHIGTFSLDLALPSAASGPVTRAWYSDDGSQLYVRTQSGRIFMTGDFDHWTENPSAAAPGDPAIPARAASQPEARTRLVAAQSRAGRVYALGRFAWRSDDGGSTWANVTGFRQESILGRGLMDLAVSPRDPDEIVVAGVTGVWRSLDGGDTWVGINDRLPNLPVERILYVPSGGGPVRIAARDNTGQEFEWAPGNSVGWRPVDSTRLAQELVTRAAISRRVEATASAFATSGQYVYAGAVDGRLFASSDLGETWRQYGAPDGGEVKAVWVDPQEPWIAIAVLAPKTGEAASRARVMRTITAGGVWQDITDNLPGGLAVHGVTADHATGALYVATDAGVYLTYSDLRSGGAPTAWTLLAGLPEARALDVKLDAAGNQLYTGVEGYGVYAALAPHRVRDLRVVSAADLESRAASPGALMSVLGARVDAVRSGTRGVPLLAASADASQIQIPFDVSGSSLPLAIQAQGRLVNIDLALKTVSPAIFAGADGMPMIVNADTGALLEPLAPAHSSGRLQVFATGLGRVTPDWPAGVAGPLENPPAVRAGIRAYLNREPLEVVKATLAPGYIGFYLVEVQLPKVVNGGQAELYLEAEGQQSNHVLVYLEP